MSETISCTSCGHAFAKGDRFCPKCGTEANMGPDTSGNLDTRIEATSPTVCVNCSAPMGRDDRFCPKCGTGRPEDATVVSHVSLRNAQAAQLAEATRGEFEIIRQLGLGAMGSVYLGEDIALSRKVAIKVIASNLLQDESMVSRFRLEAQTVASLRHPNIVNVHAVRQADDLHYFVMDFIDGPALRSIVKGHAPLPIPVVQALLYQVGSALDYAHHRGKGVIHRDIKPANIMVDREGNAYVTDFGISKIAETQTGLTQTGATIGTPEYMSPEQCRGEELTGASDQYAVGIMAYEMLTGNTPFSGSQYYVMVAHTSEDAAPITAARPDCPQHVADVVHRMLAKDPTDRWPDLESAMTAMGGKPLGRKDPTRTQITALTGATGEVAAVSPVPSAGPAPGQAPGSPADTATSVTVIGLPTRVEVGDTFTLSADVRGTTQGSIPGARVDWASTDAGIAVVTDGLVRAVKAGTAMITASVGGVTNSVSLHISEAAPAAVLIDPETVHVSSGERVSLQARIQDRHGNDLDRAIRWLTSDAGVASVTREGELVATGSGVATVTAESGGVTGTAEIVVQGTGARVPVGLRPPKRAAWKHPAVAAGVVLFLGAAGVYGAMSAGLIQPLGTGDDPVGGAGPIAPGGAAAAVALVQVDVPEASLTVGDSMRLVFTAQDSAGNPIQDAEATWAADDPAAVRFNDQGWVVAQQAGPVQLSALVSGVTGTGSFEATNPPTQTASNAGGSSPGRTGGAPSQPARENTPPPQEQETRPTPRQSNPVRDTPAPFRAIPTSFDVSVPDRIEMNSVSPISIDIRDQNGGQMLDLADQVQLTSSNPAVIAVDQANRSLRALSEGTAGISATVAGLTAGPFPVTVPSLIRDVRINSGPLSLEAGESGRALATVVGPNGGALTGFPVSWSTSDPSVATVDPTGGVTAVSEGTATLTASLRDFTAQTQVTVTAAATSLPSAADVNRLIAGYVSLVTDEDKNAVTRLHGTADEDALEDLLDWMDNNNFQATLGEISPVQQRGAAATVTFGLAMRYRSGFGGDQNRDRQFVAVFTRDGAAWRLDTVVMQPE